MPSSVTLPVTFTNERFKNTNGPSGYDTRDKLNKQMKGIGSVIRTNSESLEKVEPTRGRGKFLAKMGKKNRVQG